MLHGEDSVPDEVFERSFMWYISEFERELIALVNKGAPLLEFKINALLGLYERFGMRCLPPTCKDKLKRKEVKGS